MLVHECLSNQKRERCCLDSRWRSLFRKWSITVPLSHVRLRPDAVPSKFPSCPTHLSRETTRREDPDSKTARMEHAAMQKAIAESEEMFNRAHEEDKVHSLGELIGHLRSKEMKFWNIIEK
ncbi:hypothetical protein HPB51_005544 [Rhipicephalus microplus]|uniref:Uncharacterized protein n=1 Tax=Rhipicephalus microplus TaxID=6941 RepID=A0A9J6EY15_RHIMP|nr:hypothetical protein HPB51_005544 [Rhipicephalus microplus]